MSESTEKRLSLPMAARAELEAVAVARGLMAEAHMDEAQQAAVLTALIEAIINAVEHSHAADGQLDVHFEVTQSALRITVHDNGRGFGIDRIAAVDPKEKRHKGETRGWGLHMIQQAMDAVEVETNETGTTVTMIKKR